MEYNTYVQGIINNLTEEEINNFDDIIYKLIMKKYDSIENRLEVLPLILSNRKMSKCFIELKNIKDPLKYPDETEDMYSDRCSLHKWKISKCNKDIEILADKIKEYTEYLDKKIKK